MSPQPNSTPNMFIPRAANEGIPVAAIARIFQQPLDDVYDALYEAKAAGVIVAIPKADWPATARLADRVPSSTPHLTNDDLAFQCRQMFKLTSLEAGFLVILLRHDRVEKSKLHHIVEQQRLTRAAQPSMMEATDPKMVDVMICKLRKKLKTQRADFLIDTIWGGGYYMRAEVKTAITAFMNGEPHVPQAAEGSPASAPASDTTKH